MARHIDHHCLFAGNERTGERQFLICPSFPFSKYREEICYIVFIQAENRLLGICFLDHFCSFLSFFAFVARSFYLSSSDKSQRACVCVCVACLSAALYCCILQFCGICSVYWLSGTSLDDLAPPQVCVIVGRLSGLLAANWATLAHLRVYETAGMCLVPPGRGR